MLALWGILWARSSYSNVAFYHFGIENGLPEARILDITQDSVGFIWLAGENAIFRFDGFQFKAYRKTNESISSPTFDKINRIFTDSKGTVWIGSGNGIISYQFERDQFTLPPEGWNRVLVTDIDEDTNGRLWISTDEGLACFYPAKNQTTWYTSPELVKTPGNNFLPPGTINKVACQPDGKIWINYDRGGLYRLDPQTRAIENFETIGNFKIAESIISKIAYAGNRLYASTISHGFFSFSPDDGSVHFQNFNHFGYTIQHFQVAGDSLMWLASNNGLIRYNYQTGHHRFFTNEPSNLLSISRTAILRVYTDKEGNLWVSSGIRGIDYGLTNVPFFHFETAGEDAYQLTHKEVTSICFDHVGNMWLGYESGIVERHSENPLQKKQFPLYKDNPQTGAGSIMQIVEDSSHRIWIGGWQTGLQNLNDNGTAFDKAPIVPESLAQKLATADIRGITEDQNGILWISIHGTGIARYNPETFQMKLFRNDPKNPTGSLSNDYTYNLCTDNDNHLWIASAFGISRLNPENGQFTNYFHNDSNANSLSNNTVHTIYRDHSGIIWAGTSNGLNAFIPKLETFQPVLTETDISYLTISDIRSVKPGEIWASTQTGIIRVTYSWEAGEEKLDINSWSFGRSNGLLSTNYYARSSAVDNVGKIFFGGNEGIDFFDPDEVSFIKKNQPKLILTEFIVDGLPVYPQTRDNENEIPKLIMFHNNNTISIRFSALQFNRHSTQKFRYKLDGLNNKWFYPEMEQVATFTHLPAGKFTFCLEVSEDNEWKGNCISIIIESKPPFWKTLPFIISSAIFAFAVIMLIFWARSRVLLSRQKKLELIIEERTMELTKKNLELKKTNQTQHKLFSIISHDLRSPFSGLLGILEVVTDPGHELPGKKKNDLLVAAKNSAKNTYELLETLLTWARSQMEETVSHPKKNNLAKLLRKNIELKEPAALQKDIFFRHQLPEKLEAWFDKDMINTVIRNILNNAVKFTLPEGKIEISAWVQDEEVTVKITDTGIGLNAEETKTLFEIGKISRNGTQGEKGTGLGMIICKEFLEKNNGKIWAEPNQPSGTAFFFTLPVNKKTIPETI
jgi:signal transduction histidine kinase/ligand-binding sensor domain-containing protein